MGWISEIASGVSSGAFGGITGFAMSMVKGHFARKDRDAKFNQDMKIAEFKRQDEEAERAHVLKLHELNRLADKEETEHELSLIQTRMSGEMRKASMEDQTALGSKENVAQWVSNLLSLMRPIQTVFFLFLTAAIVIIVKEPDLTEHVIKQIIYLAALTVTWWFGDRPPQVRSSR